MSEVQQACNTSFERSIADGLGTGREGILMEVFVLTETGKLVGVFSNRNRVLSHVEECPFTVDFIQSADGIKTQERACDYHIQRVILDRVLTDA